MLNKFSGKVILSIAILLISVIQPAIAKAINGEEARDCLTKSGWTQELADKIVSKIETAEGRMIAVFDHDNTLVCGDITEGNGKSQPGFMHDMLTRMHAEHKIPVPVAGLYESNPWEFYHSWARSKPQEAYAWICTLLAGQKPEQVLIEATEYFENHMKKAIFPEMLTLVNVLQQMGVDVYIVSASAHNVVLSAAKYFGVPENRVLGIRLKIENGIIQPKVINPISFAAGKTWYIKNFAGDFPRGNIMVFGDSYKTDGHMLRFAAQQGGLALLVNPDAEITETLEKNKIVYYNLPSKPLLDN
ncbi:MAG: haloacid dehalogenase-like hydrolase [Candidatus Riflebacteria bacterium]|nr:haloacid dehalogenase-like hydrolase [Candidatus Riflebacteria bacterium]